MRLPAAIERQLIAHAVREAPRECCGLIESRDGTVAAAHPMINVADAESRFAVGSGELLALLARIEHAGSELAAIYHSHTRSAPYPSQLDIECAHDWPGVEWIIIGIADQTPTVRCYLIDDISVQEMST